MIGSRCLCTEASSVQLASSPSRQLAILVQRSATPAHNITHVRGQLVSKRNAAEELADQVQAPPPAADRRPQATSGDPDEEEEDEENQSSQGHVSERAAECHTSPEADTMTTATTWQTTNKMVPQRVLPCHQTALVNTCACSCC